MERWIKINRRGSLLFVIFVTSVYTLFLFNFLSSAEQVGPKGTTSAIKQIGLPLTPTERTGSPRRNRILAASQPGNSRFLVPQIPASAEKDYTIGGKDVLSIVVFEEPDLSSNEIRVSIDGFITFPLVGRVQVQGMTTHQVEQELTRRLSKDFLVNPQVTVQVKEYASKVINVLGAIRTPGALPLQGPSTLLEVLGRAGGVNIEEAGQSLTILRPVTGKSSGIKNITISLDRLLRQGDLSQNVPLQNGDTVFVHQADQIFVFGEVNRPGPYKLRSEDVSVVEAITMAGGTTRLAASNRTRIVRVENGKERVIRVNVESILGGDRKQDVRLQAGDIIVIPQTYF